MSEKCGVCGNFLISDVVTVKRIGLCRLKESSEERGDGKHVLFEGLAEINLHRKCRLLYIDSKSIAAHKEKIRKENSTSKEPNLTDESFNFANMCLFCNEIADNDFIKAQSKYPIQTRITVSQVTKTETQLSILQAATLHNDDWSQRVSYLLLVPTYLPTT